LGPQTAFVHIPVKPTKSRGEEGEVLYL